MKTQKPEQFEFTFPATAWDSGHEHSGWISMNHVPSGFYCAICERIIYRHFVPDNQPEIIGYESADWAWKHKHGKDWTTDDL